MSNFRFKYYAVDVDWNSSIRGRTKVEQYNIFDNSRVQEWTEKAVKKYLRAPSKFWKYRRNYETNEYEYIYGWDAFLEELRSIFMNQFWARCEYEFLILPWPCNENEVPYKIDIWEQLEPNLEFIAHEVIRQWKEYKKGLKK